MHQLGKMQKSRWLVVELSQGEDHDPLVLMSLFSVILTPLDCLGIGQCGKNQVTIFI
jgi:hypothetical protein